MQALESQEEEVKSHLDDVTDRSPMTSGDPVAAIAAGSVLLAWYQFYVKGNKEAGIFIGLWAPTLLSAAGYLQQKAVIGKIKRGMESI